MSFTTTLEPTHAVIRLEKHLDADGIAQLRSLFWSYFTEQHLPHVVICLASKLTLDAAALSLLVGARNIATKYLARLSLICAPGQQTDLLRQLDLHQYFDIFAQLDEALAGPEA